MPAVMDDELKRLFDAIRQDSAALRQEFAADRQANARDNAALRQEFAADRQANAAAHAETRRHFDVVTEATRQEIRLDVEAVALVDEKLDREATEIRQEMRTGFTETQAIIKFSDAELDRRMRTIE